MKCYVHTDKDAVGFCSVCNQGVCTNCAVKIGGKLYCRECADKEFTGKKEIAKKPTGMTLLVILFGLGGVLSLLDGVLAIESWQALVHLGYTWEMAYAEVLLWGAISMTLGVLLLIAAYAIWNLKRWGGFIGIILVLGTLMLNLRVLLSSLRAPSYFIDDIISSIIGIGFNLIILAYLKKNWELLK